MAMECKKASLGLRARVRDSSVEGGAGAVCVFTTKAGRACNRDEVASDKGPDTSASTGCAREREEEGRESIGGGREERRVGLMAPKNHTRKTDRINANNKNRIMSKCNAFFSRLSLYCCCFSSRLSLPL